MFYEVTHGYKCVDSWMFEIMQPHSSLSDWAGVNLLSVWPVTEGEWVGQENTYYYVYH